jgi:hypothetical protein
MGDCLEGESVGGGGEKERILRGDKERSALNMMTA